MVKFYFEDIFRNIYTVEADDKITVDELSKLMNQKIKDVGRYDKSAFSRLVLNYKDESKGIEEINDEEDETMEALDSDFKDLD